MAEDEGKESRPSRRRMKQSAEEKEHKRKDQEDQKEVSLEDEEKKVAGSSTNRRASTGWGASDNNPAAAAAADQLQPPVESERPRRRRGQTTTSNDSRYSKPKNKHFADDDDDGELTEIMEIPDLEEEEQVQDITTQVAEAPRNTTRKVQSMKELEKDTEFALPTTGTHDFDLTLLTSNLCPQMAVLEDDEPWDFDSLLRDVTQEIQADIDEKELAEKEKNPIISSDIP